MTHYLDPKNDLVFKRIFGEHPDLLISFLNALMPLEPGRLIEYIEYLPPELVPENPAKKYSIVDVRCRDNHNRQFIVEMQMYWSTAFYNRMIFNASKAYVRQLDKSEHFELLQPVYGLGIINDIFDRKTEEFYHHYQTINRNNTEEIIKGLEFVLVELPKFKNWNWNNRKMAVLWLRFLQEVKNETTVVSEELQSNPDIRKALDICEKGAFTPIELATYERSRDSIMKEKAFLYASHAEGLAKGLAEGIAEGRAEGKAEGLAEGIAEGERKNTVRVVVNGFKAGVPVETIALMSGLSPDEVLAVLKQEGFS